MSGPYRELGEPKLTEAEQMLALSERAAKELTSTAQHKAEALVPKVLDLIRAEAAAGKTEIYAESIMNKLLPFPGPARQHENDAHARWLIWKALIELLRAKGFNYSPGSISLGWIKWSASNG